MAKKIDKALKVCKLDPGDYVAEPGDIVLDKAKDVAKEMEIIQYGVNVYTEIGFRVCLKGSCGGIAGGIKRIFGKCSPFHWNTSKDGPRQCK